MGVLNHLASLTATLGLWGWVSVEQRVNLVFSTRMIQNRPEWWSRRPTSRENIDTACHLLWPHPSRSCCLIAWELLWRPWSYTNIGNIYRTPQLLYIHYTFQPISIHWCLFDRYLFLLIWAGLRKHCYRFFEATVTSSNIPNDFLPIISFGGIKKVFTVLAPSFTCEHLRTAERSHYFSKQKYFTFLKNFRTLRLQFVLFFDFLQKHE